MGKFYSPDLRERAVSAYLGGETCCSVGARFQIAPSTLMKWVALLKRQGDLRPGKVGGHRKRALDPHRDFILARIEDTPHFTLDRLADLLGQRGVNISVVAVWSFLKAEGLSFKKSLMHWSSCALTWRSSVGVGSTSRQGSTRTGWSSLTK